MLLLSHSDVTVDSRILKSQVAAKEAGFESLALGVSTEGERGSSREGALSFRISALLWRNDYFAGKDREGVFLGRISYLLMYFEIASKFTFRALSFRPRVVHCNDWLVLPIAVLISRLTRAKLLYDAHELESDTNQLPEKMKRLIARIEMAAWPKIDFFVTVSESIRKWYLRAYGTKPSELIMNSPVFPEAIQSGDSDYLRKIFGILPGKPIFVYVGQICPGRGIEIILDVFSNPNCRSAVVFLGDGDSAPLVESASQSNSNIFLHRPVAHQDVVGVISSADAGLCLIENVSLSDFMCLPNKVFEYAYAGLWVIASAFPELTKIVTENSLGIVIDPTEASLEGAVRTFESQFGSFSRTPRLLHSLSWGEQEKKLKASYSFLLLTETGETPNRPQLKTKT